MAGAYISQSPIGTLRCGRASNMTISSRSTSTAVPASRSSMLTADVVKKGNGRPECYPGRRSQLSSVCLPFQTPVPPKPSDGRYCFSAASNRNNSSRRRTLDHFPMQYSRQDVYSRMGDSKRTKMTSIKKTERAQMACESLSRYSKRLFEDAITKAKEGKTVKSKQHSSSLPEIQGFLVQNHSKGSPSYGQTYLAVSHSGPTTHGSPLYDKRADVLNAIRLQKVGKRGTSGNEGDITLKEITNLTPEIREVLSKSNQKYKVISSSNNADNTSIVTPNDISAWDNYVLLPVDPDINNNCRKDTFIPSENQESISASETEENNRNITNIDVSHEMSVLASLSVDDEKRGQSSSANDNSRPRTNNTKSSHSDAVTAPKKPKGAGGRRGSNKLKCWVDTATVSSTVSKKSADVNQQQQQQVEAGNCRVLPEPVPRQHHQDDEEDQSGTVMSLRQLQKHVELSLPDFICPSSEDKSRQARTRQWLETTTFTWANKTVPLV